MLMNICRVCQVFEGHSEYRLLSWLGEMEETHRIVIYETDKAVTPWTQRCVRQVHICELWPGLHSIFELSEY
jgi:hypothetical protein